MLGTFGLAGAFSFFSNKVLACGEGGLLATDDDDVAEIARRLRSQGMSSGSWSRFTGETDSYDVRGLGFNYRLDEPRAALLLSRLQRLERDVQRRRELTRAYRDKLAGVDGVGVPYTDDGVAHATCYVMPVVVDDEERRDAVRRHMKQRGVQTSLLYPAVHEFTAYRERYGLPSLPRSEHIARARDHVAAVRGVGGGRAGSRRRRRSRRRSHDLDDPADGRADERGGPRRRRRVPALGLVDDGAAHAGLRGGGRRVDRRASTPWPCRRVPPPCISPAPRSGSARGTR